MEIKQYEFGGICELRIVFSFVGTKACCSAYWRDGRYNLDQEVLPANPTKITGSLCQYMLKTLSKISHTEVSEIIKAHISDISRFIHLIVKIGYEKMNVQLKYRLLVCMQQGINMWKILITRLVGYEESEFKEQVKEISRYIIILEVMLQDFKDFHAN
jgi:hypothetical protein